MIRKIVALLSLIALTGCATLPTEFNIQQGPEIAPETQQEFAFYTPSGPSPNATAQEIVSGFLGAGTSPLNDYGVAREFLSEDFAQRWNPNNQTIIRAGAPVFRQAGQTLMVVEVNSGARVDEQGRYIDSEAGDATSLRFQLIEQDGQLRISSAPNLTVVTPPVFSVVFNAFPLYFVDSNSQTLVPDLRWFPSRTSTATRLVNALLDGPSSWLAPGVKSAIPEGTQLTINAVRTLEGVAQVDFDADALAAGTQDRRIMLGQLKSTLSQIAGITDVALSVNGSIQEILTGALEPTATVSPIFVLTDNGIGPLNSTGAAGIPGTAALVSSYEPTLIALTEDGERVAFATSAGVFEIRPQTFSTQIVQLNSVSEVAALEYDSFGSLWVFPSDAAYAVEVYDRSTVIRKFASESTGVRLAATISAEGVRIAQAIQAPDSEPRIDIGIVTRDSNFIPLKVNPGLSVTPVLGVPVSLAWQGPANLRVLESTASGLTAFSEYPVTGPRIQLAMPPVVGTRIQGAVSASSTYMLTRFDELWLFTGGSWRRLATGVAAITAIR